MALGPAGRYKEKQKGATTLLVLTIGTLTVFISGLWLRLDFNLSLKKLNGRPSNLAGIVVRIRANSERANYWEPPRNTFANNSLGNAIYLPGDCLKGTKRDAANEESLADSHDQIANSLGGGMAEETVKHLFTREKGLLTVGASNIGDHLSLDLPEGD